MERVSWKCHPGVCSLTTWFLKGGELPLAVGAWRHECRRMVRVVTREGLNLLYLLWRQRKKEFLGGPVVRTLDSTAGAWGSVCGQGTKMPQAAWCGKKKKKVFYSIQNRGTITSNSLPPYVPCCGYMSSFLVGINQEWGCLVITNLV